MNDDPCYNSALRPFSHLLQCQGETTYDRPELNLALSNINIEFRSITGMSMDILNLRSARYGYFRNGLVLDKKINKP